MGDAYYSNAELEYDVELMLDIIDHRWQQAESREPF